MEKVFISPSGGFHHVFVDEEFFCKCHNSDIAVYIKELIEKDILRVKVSMAEIEKVLIKHNIIKDKT